MSEERRGCEQLHDGGQEVLAAPLDSHARAPGTTGVLFCRRLISLTVDTSRSYHRSFKSYF